MKQALIILLAVIGLITSIFLWFRSPGAVATSAGEKWPGSMGNLESVTDRWPRVEPNEASVKLTSLAESLLRNNNAVDDFIAREITSDQLNINEAPELPDVSSIRDLLLHEKVVWQRYDEVADQRAIEARVMQMTVAKALVANALAKARSNDPSAWDDLFAVWKLARSLDHHPQMMAQTAALSMARMVNAVAWKMPLPAPAWISEMQVRDDVRPLLDSFQHQTAEYWKGSAWWFPTKWLARSIDHDRQIAESLYSFTACDVNTPMNQLGTDLSSLWRRAFRYRAEREATANALRVREGKSIETTSKCSDGNWMFDGSTLRFSREITTAPPDTPMPLVLRVTRGL